ncbi:adenosine deaminase [Leptolinea sp. HRD-7]|jgi:adenosine deaminase|nr:adenosine deaminase [Leptolinea sp. HRD-7]
MNIKEFIRQMPKVELHVHLEGSIEPQTLLKLAERHNVTLPARNLDELHDWYKFTGFDHFIEVYLAISSCICTADDLELIAAEFLKDRAEQNILYSEVIYTPYTHLPHIPLDEQLAALNRARKTAEEKWGVRINLAPDISRERRPIEASHQIAEWAIKNRNNGITSLGLGGPEIGNPPELFASTFEIARKAGFPATPHAGETEGPASIWGALKTLNAVRIGHGVRCLEDPSLVSYLKEKQIPLEVCPSSNVCLHVVPDLTSHPLPRLMDEGLFVTINSDDPPMFNTNLTEEYLRITDEFGFSVPQLKQFVFNAARASLLPIDEKNTLIQNLTVRFSELEKQLN